MTTESAPITSRQLVDALRNHYIKPNLSPGELAGGTFLTEVSYGSDTRARRIDALYAGYTTASGKMLVGHEVKVSRADWQRELDKAGKADAWADQCHQWWIVAPPNMIRPAELPEEWGLLEPGTRGRRMRVAKPAFSHRDRAPSWTAVRSIMARQDSLAAAAITEGRYEVQQEAFRKAERQVLEQVDRSRPMTSEQRQRLKLLDQLEQHLGLTLDDWAQRDRTSGELTSVDPRRFKVAADLADTLDRIPELYGAGAAADRLEQAASQLRQLAGLVSKAAKQPTKLLEVAG